MTKNNNLMSLFSNSYTEARNKFIDAATAAGARLHSIAHPKTGPEGEPLFMDFAVLGSDDAKSAIVIVSGTHGIEGFCGSFCQTALLNSQADLEKLSDHKLVFLHAHNPHGFAWLRRTNEDNVDLNRNYVDFSEPQDSNSDYESIREIILPREFNEKSEADHRAWIETNGKAAYQKAVMTGQRCDSQGIFYGGTEDSWSSRTVKAELPKLLAKQSKVALLDIHTGLGPFGHGDIIHAYPKDSHEYQVSADWFENDVIGVNAGEYGEETAAVPRGPIVASLDLVLPGKASYAYVMEYGTVEFDEVFHALRADNWLHVYGDVDSERGREIKAKMREAFYSDTADWKQLIWDRAIWTFLKMGEGLRKFN